MSPISRSWGTWNSFNELICTCSWKLWAVWGFMPLCSCCFPLFLPMTFLVVSVCGNDDHPANFQRITLTLTFGSPICSSLYCFKCLLSDSLLNWNRSKFLQAQQGSAGPFLTAEGCLLESSDSVVLVIQDFSPLNILLDADGKYNICGW